MKFDFVIGNPPYQDETIGDNTTYAPPIYHLFLDSAYAIADVVEMIHPARFLFNAGSTPKAWNHKMLNDEHFQILHYEPKSSEIFSNTDIKGGIAISYHNIKKRFEPIETFTSFPEINSVLKKVSHREDFQSLSDIVSSRTTYRLTDDVHKDYPNAISKLSKGHAYDMASNIFQRLPEIFHDQKPNDGKSYLKLFGRQNNIRLYKWIQKNYVQENEITYKYKVMVPQANGSGALGEVISTPLIGEPLIGFTESFISIGKVETSNEAEAILKYIKSKFARAMLGILKVTQANTSDKWKYVPLQDFTSQSDIDWSQSIAEIDRQLYEKYGLADNEIEFIETHVKEMV